MAHKNISTLFHQKYKNITLLLLLRYMHSYMMHQLSQRDFCFMWEPFYIYSCSIVFVSFDKIERYSFNWISIFNFGLDFCESIPYLNSLVQF